MAKFTPPPVPPGEIVLEDYMKPEGISINQLARDFRVPVTRISTIVNRTPGITGDTALRLGRYFSNSAEFWMNLQRNYELRIARGSAPASGRGRRQTA